MFAIKVIISVFLRSIKLSVTLYPFANCALNTDVKRTIIVTKKSVKYSLITSTKVAELHLFDPSISIDSEQKAGKKAASCL